MQKYIILFTRKLVILLNKLKPLSTSSIVYCAKIEGITKVIYVILFIILLMIIISLPFIGLNMNSSPQHFISFPKVTLPDQLYLQRFNLISH